MKVKLESTDKIVELNGIPCRIWEGSTYTGIKVHAYINMIAIDKDEPEEAHAEFQADLNEHRTPSAEVEAIPLRMII